MSQGTSLPRTVLSAQVKDRLLEAILDGRYPPGARIIETRLARELGVSQAPVREALRDLEALGLIETSAFRGARVRHPTRDELLEAFAVRAQLEGLAARLASTRLTSKELEELAGYLGEMHRAARRGDPHAEAIADARFHGRVVELSGNATLQRVWGLLEPYSRTYITLSSAGVDSRRIADLHRPVLDALRERDAERAVRALHDHYVSAAAMLPDPWEYSRAGADDDAPESTADGAHG